MLGMMLTLADRRPAHLTEVHAALTALPAADQRRLGVTEDWKAARTSSPTARPSAPSASSPGRWPKTPRTAPPPRPLPPCWMTCSKPASRQSIRTPARRSPRTGPTWSPSPAPRATAAATCADPEASWGHRNSNLPGPKGEMFFGYYLSAATMTRDEDGPPVPELTRRITLSSCHADPVRALAPVLTRMPAAGIPPRRHPRRLRLRPPRRRRLGPAAPRRRRAAGPGPAPARPRPPGHHPRRDHRQRNLYCPATPQPLLHLGPLAPAATADQVTAHDQQTAELARHKLGRLTADDADGYHRVTCPAAMGKLRCPLRPASMTLDRVPPGDPHPAAAPAGLLHPADPHHRARTSRRRPGRNTTIPRRRTAAPTPAAPPPNEASPPSRTRPATPSPAAGAASWA